MKEFAMALWTMTASHYEWPKPPAEPVAVVRTDDQETSNELTRKERAELRKALDRIAHCATGNLVLDEDLELYSPELKPRCGR